MKSAPVRSIGFPNPFPKVFWIWDTDSPLKRHSQYRAADALYLNLDDAPAEDSREIAPGVILDYDASGKVS